MSWKRKLLKLQLISNKKITDRNATKCLSDDSQKQSLQSANASLFHFLSLQFYGSDETFTLLTVLVIDITSSSRIHLDNCPSQS